MHGNLVRCGDYHFLFSIFYPEGFLLHSPQDSVSSARRKGTLFSATQCGERHEIHSLYRDFFAREHCLLIAGSFTACHNL
jgi:hypothetical protein